jgi:hypothetical protein
MRGFVMTLLEAIHWNQILARIPYFDDPKEITGLDAIFLFVVMVLLSLYVRHRRRAWRRKHPDWDSEETDDLRPIKRRQHKGEPPQQT